ncbi:hypothetical protein OHC33_001152 [Knufia fluminis]|uniref:Uncharacterized protein n=1 Tax=Knufia fluminis TaxID=191047 RepID=A0AAN8I7B0_9EURO|nr:hypothetical protein OHC33_001152 [Knufia fluminis]
MGQSQSSTNDTSADANEPPVKQDYYELLGVERTATDDEIKKAYRRRALELHPDRNYGNEEGATRLFAEIQAAHEVLSDPQERAWYDSHRDVLLRGEQPGGAGGEDYSYNMKLTTSDEVLKLMMRFNKNVQYTNSPSGFYGGLSEFFKQLAKEEDIACQWQDLDYLDYPEFGSKDDGYEDIVRPFYGAWTGFATKKNYSWKDQYRLSDAPDRRIRRLMEKENQKLRDEAIAEYSDAVRSLVAFVRKRDPRVQNNQKSEAERQKFLRESAAAQAARMKAKRQAEMNKEGGISAWAHTSSKDEHEGGFSSESEVEEHEYECVVCDKTFKSDKQFQAHEKSKKHIKLLKELKRDMRKEGKELDLEPKPAEMEAATDEDQEIGLPTETQEDHEPTPFMEDEPDIDRDGDHINLDAHESSSQEPDQEDADDDYAPRAAVASRLASEEIDQVTTAATSLMLDDTPAGSGTDTPSQSKVGKAKQKRARKAAQQGGAETPSASQFICQICRAQFTSRTKLFDHIKSEGHTAIKTQTTVGGSKGGKAKKKK